MKDTDNEQYNLAAVQKYLDQLLLDWPDLQREFYSIAFGSAMKSEILKCEEQSEQNEQPTLAA